MFIVPRGIIATCRSMLSEFGLGRNRANFVQGLVGPMRHTKLGPNSKGMDPSWASTGRDSARFGLSSRPRSRSERSRRQLPRAYSTAFGPSFMNIGLHPDPSSTLVEPSPKSFEPNPFAQAPSPNAIKRDAIERSKTAHLRPNGAQVCGRSERKIGRDSSPKLPTRSPSLVKPSRTFAEASPKLVEPALGSVGSAIGSVDPALGMPGRPTLSRTLKTGKSASQSSNLHEKLVPGAAPPHAA